MQHKSRIFAGLPGRDKTRQLVCELAIAPCPFSPVAADRPLTLYGSGNLGRLARNHLKSVGHDFIMAIDRNASQKTEIASWSGMRLLHPADVPQSVKNEARVAVCVVTSPYVPIERALSELGFKDIVPFYDLAESFRHLHPLSNGWFAPPLGSNDIEAATEVLARWDDDVSRAHHLQFIAWHRLRAEWVFADAPIPDCPRFFIPELTCTLRDNEILVDAGAHHGTVTEIFVKRIKGAFRHIAAIEPDSFNRDQLASNLRVSLPDDPRVTIYDCALAEADIEATFHDGLDYASQLAETGRQRVKVRPLDALGITPTFVKLHLEGAELAALKGCRETLAAYRPIVAATVYHNADGIWRTPLWLMETLPRYRFLFRAHSWCGTGAVIYAIPLERYNQIKREA